MSNVGFGIDFMFYEVGHPDFCIASFQQCHIIQNLKVGELNILYL